MAFIKKNKTNFRTKSDFPDLTTPKELIDFAQRKGIETTPLTVAELAQALNIVVRYEPMNDDDSGRLKKDKKNSTWVMTVNSLHHPHRQRFTMAHEIAHRICHAAQNDDFKDDVFFRNGESNPTETEANRFASEILMPAKDFLYFVERTSTKVEDIAEHFHVSSLAVRVRAKSLKLKGHNL
jgi:Zn-dependent peptidase ImmA (M78 family)